ncbi:unnamed protein product [Chrysoparadoxa australica]
MASFIRWPLLLVVVTLAGQSAAFMVMASKVLVTGAGGRTGAIVVEKLMEKEGYNPVGFVHSEKSAKKLRKQFGKEFEVIVGDVMDADAVSKACEGMDSVVLCTSAVPKPVISSIFKVLFNKYILRKADAGVPKFTFPQTPEDVDYTGALNQINGAKAAGVKKFVFLSSMGGTQPDNFLNTLGDGNILLWKRKAEIELTKSGVPWMDYTVVHPGGLLRDAGGKRQLLVGVNDAILAQQNRSVPRADVAEMCVQCLHLPEAKNLAFDLASLPEGEGVVTQGDAAFAGLLGPLAGKYDYSISDQPAMKR